MAVGGCFCGKVRVEYAGQPITSALCYCFDCRKRTGALYTYNFVINTADLKITGSPKGAVKTADSGNRIKNYFCSDCGSPLYGMRMMPDGTPSDKTILRAGILDDIGILNEHKPKVEVYTGGRVCWLSPTEGADQFTGMPALP